MMLAVLIVPPDNFVDVEVLLTELLAAFSLSQQTRNSESATCTSNSHIPSPNDENQGAGIYGKLLVSPKAQTNSEEYQENLN